MQGLAFGWRTALLSAAIAQLLILAFAMGLNFSAFVNGLRAERVADALKAGDREGLLDLALTAGFASKASFNRAFKLRFGMSPSAFREQVSNPKNPPASFESEARSVSISATTAA